MGLKEVLESIRATGETQQLEIEQAADLQVREILNNTAAEAHEVREAARLEASAPAGAERARILHRAHLESLQNLGSAREALIDAALDQTRGRLGNLRAEKSYYAVLRQLVAEALAEIAASNDDGGHVCLEADPLDQDTLSAILAEMGLDLAVQYSLSTWGGVVALSDDGRIVVINTLETRLERALPYLRHNLAALFEDSTPLSDESLPELSMPTPTAQ